MYFYYQTCQQKYPIHTYSWRLNLKISSNNFMWRDFMSTSIMGIITLMIKDGDVLIVHFKLFSLGSDFNKNLTFFPYQLFQKFKTWLTSSTVLLNKNCQIPTLGLVPLKSLGLLRNSLVPIVESSTFRTEKILFNMQKYLETICKMSELPSCTEEVNMLTQS